MASNAFKRLPRICMPLHYYIELKPCFKSFTFSGKQTVSLEITEGISEIILNSRFLDIKFASLDENVVDFQVNPENETLVLKLPSLSKVGHSKLDLEYTGIIGSKMEGLYRSSYDISEDKKEHMIATQFEPTGARQVFPCWDEPEFKSVFSIKLFAPKDKIAISNMPVISRQEYDEHFHSYLFEDSPKMSSYLVAFVIGDIEYVEAKDANDVLVRIYSRKGFVSDQNQGLLALNTACCSLPFFGKYFQQMYPLPKIDLIAIPDFAGGAMENWGLVTFRERCLLANLDEVSATAKQSIALTVSHELAHMWFGNLVTMRWWTDLWLKEGFANWIEYLCVNECYPDMDIWTQFTSRELVYAMHLDALSTSHPIEVEVSTPHEIDEIFDTISYCKGASLIHMLNAFLGSQIFRQGMCSYLSRHAYDNAMTEDLWSALSEASDLDVGSLMRPWTQTIGFPVLSIRPLRTDNKCVYVQLGQEQYRLPTKEPVTGPKRLWPIPLTLKCSSADGLQSCTFKHVLKSEVEEICIPLSWSPDALNQCLVQANADATGYYHTRYDDSNQLQLLARQLRNQSSNPSNRIVFVNDGFALAKAGFISIFDWLKTLPEFMVGEDCDAVWRVALVSGLSSYVQRIVHLSDIPLKDYHHYLLTLVRPALKRFDIFTNNSCTKSWSHNDNLLRSLLISVAGSECGDSDVVLEAKRRYDMHKAGSCPIPNSLRAAIYNTVIRHYPNVIQEFMDSFKSIKSPEEVSFVLSALGAASSEASLKQVLTFCLDSNGPVRDQDRLVTICAAASWSLEARNMTWNVLKANWSHVCDMYGGQHLLSHLIKSVLSGFAKEEKRLEINEFFELNPVSCPRTVSQALEVIEANTLLLERDGMLIGEALRQFHLENQKTNGCH